MSRSEGLDVSRSDGRIFDDVRVRAYERPDAHVRDGPGRTRRVQPGSGRGRTGTAQVPDDRRGRTGTARSPVDRRGQAHTLEAVVAAMVLVASVAFVLQATALTPQSSSSANEFVETRQERLAAAVLDSAVADGLLSPTLRYWDAAEGTFHRTSVDGTYVDGGPPTAFGERLNETLFTQSHAVNVNVHYVSVDGKRRVERLVHSGEPSDHAVRASRPVTLYDDDPILAADGTATAETLASTGSYFAVDASPDSPVYNVVVVEVVVWRM